MATTYQTPGVYVEEIPSSSGQLTAGDTAVAAFVGFTAKAPTDDPKDPDGIKPRKVTNWSEFERLYGGFKSGIMLPYSVYGYFLNGGSKAYIVRIPHTLPSNDSGMLALPTGDRSLNDSKAKGVVTFTAKRLAAAEGGDPGAPMTDVKINIEPAAPAPAPAAADDDDDDDETRDPSYDITITGGAIDEPKVYAGVTLLTVADKLEDDTRVAVKLVADTDKLNRLAAELRWLPTGVFSIEPAEGPPMEKPPSFTGSEAERTGITGLSIADDVTMVMVPDLITAANTLENDDDKLALWKNVQLTLINHCEGQGNRMAILDAPKGMSPQQVLEWRKNEAGYASPYATLYYPWVEVDNPVAQNGNRKIAVPPSGHVAGLWARTDDTRGVWKAPANDVLRGVLEVERDISGVEQSDLNPEGINCIRSFASRGIRVWGARTLSDTDEWKYLNVRRLFNMIEAAIEEGTQYAVFEPNDQTLWSGLTRTVSSFLRGLWRDGALFGATETQAFYVKCDSETNTDDQINKGMVVVEVGIAPVKPAEFVIFRIAQMRDDAGGEGGEE